MSPRSTAGAPPAALRAQPHQRRLRARRRPGLSSPAAGRSASMGDSARRASRAWAAPAPLFARCAQASRGSGRLAFKQFSLLQRAAQQGLLRRVLGCVHPEHPPRFPQAFGSEPRPDPTPPAADRTPAGASSAAMRGRVAAITRPRRGPPVGGKVLPRLLELQHAQRGRDQTHPRSPERGFRTALGVGLDLHRLGDPPSRALSNSSTPVPVEPRSASSYVDVGAVQATGRRRGHQVLAEAVDHRRHHRSAHQLRHGLPRLSGR